MWPRLLAVLLLLGAAPAHAQFPAELRGRVTDALTGAAVPGARVEEVGGGARATTAPDGRFLLRGLLPGAREVRVAAPGFRERRLGVEVENGRSAWLAVELEPAAVEVEGLRVVAERGEAGATTLDRARIEASGARELGELLRGQPGVTVTRRGGPGSPATVSIRGSGAGQVLVLVDGVPVNSPLTGEADLSAVPLEAVERVVVLRGAQSARFGGRALAGVVAVETRRPAGPELAARAATGSWGERGAALSAGGEAGALSGLVAAEWSAVEGDFSFAVPAVRGGGRATRRNADAATASALATAALRRGDAELRLRASALRVERGMPGSIVQPAPAARQEQERASGSVSAAAPLGGVEWRAVVDVQRQTAGFRDPDPPLAAPYRETVEVDGLGAALSAARALGPLALSGGVEARELRFRSTLLAADAPGRQRLRAGWVQGRWSPAQAAGWTVEVSPALRADWSSLLDEAVLSPRVALAAATARVSLRLSAGSAFAPPTLSDQFFQEGVLARPNPDLRPERVRGELEAGVELRDLRLGGVRLDAEAAAFRADVDGMILWSPDHRFVWRPGNFDVRRRGWEAGAAARLPFAGAELRGSASRVSVEYASPALRGQVAYRPRLNASGAASARLPGGFRGEALARYVGERRIAPGSALNALPPHWLADARLGRALALGGWRGEATLAVENLFDRDAAMLVDYPYPGRSWSIALRVRHEPRRAAPGDLPGTTEGEGR